MKINWKVKSEFKDTREYVIAGRWKRKRQRERAYTELKAENKLVVVEEDPTKVSRLKSISEEKITQKEAAEEGSRFVKWKKTEKRELTNLL